MKKTTYPDTKDQALIDAFHTLKTKKEIEHFLRDLLTMSEIREFSKRFNIATKLWLTEKTYMEIAQEAKTSTTTVTRVAHWLYKQGLQGYQTALKRLFPKA